MRFPKRQIFLAAFFSAFFCVFVTGLYAQYDAVYDVHDENVPSEEVFNIEPEDNESVNDSAKFKNVNVDAEFMYGQYNNISSNLSILQSLEGFTYRLNSDYKRSNDFGYENSSYYDNAIELNAQTELFEKWTFSPLVDVRNESHGMFSNPVYSREEKDRLIVLFKGEYKPLPVRWRLNLGGTQYIHRLVGQETADAKFSKFNEELEWEHVFSASQKLSLRHYSCQYYYRAGSTASDDYHMVNELTWNVRLFEYMKLSLSPMAIWNKDDEWVPSGKVQLDSDNLTYFTMGISYTHELLPFQPENLYYDQRYILPDNTLPPQLVDRIEGNITFSMQNKPSGDFYLRTVKVKSKGMYEYCDNFYNYKQASHNVLTGGVIESSSFHLSSELSFDMAFYSYGLMINTGYAFSKYDSDENITYRPQHQITSSLAVSSNNFSITWGNDYNSSVYIDTERNEKLKGAILGSLGLQAKVAEAIFLNLKVNNLYDAQYSYRDGYPEPGLTILAGLHIVI